MSLFITFEGPEGAGKSTQVTRVSELLRHAGWNLLVTREPGGTLLGERIRDILLSGNDYDIVPRAEALLMTAARAQHIEEVIRPALDQGTSVICDRFTDSTLAYQGAGRGLPVPELEDLQLFAAGELRPDLRILLDLPAETGLERRRNSGSPLNRLDQDDLAFHERVRAWYVQAATMDPDRWLVLDATRDPCELAEEITQNILERLEFAAREVRADGAGA